MPLSLISLTTLSPIGTGLNRPSSVAVGPDGRVCVADLGAGCAILRKDGGFKRVGQTGGVPNGLHFDRRGRLIIANFGLHAQAPGPLQRLDLVSGGIETVSSAIGGRRLIASHTPVVAADGTIYCTHSTWAPTLGEGLRAGVSDGFVYRVDPAGNVSIVAEGLSFPTGCCLDPEGKMLYVVQSTAANVIRFEIARDGTLRPGFPYGQKFGVIPDDPPRGRLETRERARLGYADGCAFDQEGNLWIALSLANRIVAITPTQSLRVVMEDPDMKILRAPSSITFSGPDMRDVYIGSFLSDYIVKTKSPVPGVPPASRR